LFSRFIVRCNATAIFYYNLVCMLVFDGKAIYIYIFISTYTRMKLKKSGIPKENLDKNDDFVYSIPLFCCRFFFLNKIEIIDVLGIVFVLTIQPVIFFSTTYIFYSIYFNIQYNIELIFANTSIIEY
jgi:hypothetical protein